MRSQIKILLVILACLFNLPLWIGYRAISLVLGREQAFYSFSQFLSLFPGVSGNYLRYGFYKLTLKYLGQEVCICFGVTFSHPDTEVYEGVYIGPFCNIGLCTIRKNTLLGTDVHIVSGTKQHFFDSLQIPIKNQGGHLQKISIGEDCWIGNKSLVAAPLGDQCVLGSGSIVVKEIPSKSVAAGNPAKVIKSRT